MPRRLVLVNAGHGNHFAACRRLAEVPVPTRHSGTIRVVNAALQPAGGKRVGRAEAPTGFADLESELEGEMHLTGDSVTI